MNKKLLLETLPGATSIYMHSWLDVGELGLAGGYAHRRVRSTRKDGRERVNAGEHGIGRLKKLQ